MTVIRLAVVAFSQSTSLPCADEQDNILRIVTVIRIYKYVWINMVYWQEYTVTYKCATSLVRGWQSLFWMVILLQIWHSL